MTLITRQLFLGALVALTCPLHAGLAAVQFTNLYTFGGPPTGGYGPIGSLVRDASGNLYGVTASGGAYSCAAQGKSGCGTVFSLTPPTAPGAAWSESVLWNFGGNSADGILPQSGVILGNQGILYGAAELGGGSCSASPYGCGVIYSLSPPVAPGGQWTEAILWTFGVTPGDGETPYGLTLGGGGVLYGVTINGGAFGMGTVFSLTPPASPAEGWTEAILWSFGSPVSNGAYPEYLVLGGGGVLYGTTAGGGSTKAGCSIYNHGCGVVFSLAPPVTQGDPWTETALYASIPATGTPTSVTVGPHGVLYGASSEDTNHRGGAIFSLSPPGKPGGAWTENKVWIFPKLGRSARDGEAPAPVIVEEKSGKIFGTTSFGGSGHGGTVFSLSPPGSTGGAWTFTTLHRFADVGGAIPSGGLLRVDGVMYGATETGGSSALYGTAYSIEP